MPIILETVVVENSLSPSHFSVLLIIIIAAVNLVWVDTLNRNLLTSLVLRSFLWPNSQYMRHTTYLYQSNGWHLNKLVLGQKEQKVKGRKGLNEL